jgi:hypothetical protein
MVVSNIATPSAPTATPTQRALTPGPDVTHYRGNPRRTGAYDFPALRGPVGALWQTSLSEGIYGAPMFADGLLYVCGSNRV